MSHIILRRYILHQLDRHPWVPKVHIHIFLIVNIYLCIFEVKTKIFVTATDVIQPNLPDGVVMPQGVQNVPNPYARQYITPYMPAENDPYAASYAYPMSKFSKPEDNYSYSSYTPPQYSTQMPEQQTYANPHYSATQNNGTVVTDSQNGSPYINMNQANVNPSTNQYNVYNDPYMTNQMGNTFDPNAAQYNQVNQDFNASFAAMQVSAPKAEPVSNYSGEYSQTHYSVQYPQSHTPNMATYSNAGQNTNTNIVESPLPPGNNMNNSYTDQMAQYGQAIPNVSQNFVNQQPNIQYSVPNSANQTQNIPNPHIQYSMPNASNTIPNVPASTQNFANSMQNVPSSIPSSMNPVSMPSSMGTVPAVSGYSEQQYAYSSTDPNALSQGYVYTNAENLVTATTNASIPTFSVGQTYGVTNNPTSYIDPNLSQIDALDKPIKSHVTGEALSSNIPKYQNYTSGANYVADQNFQPTSTQFTDQTNVNYGQVYQNHPGYTYNATSGNYDYNYGSQNAYSNYGQTNVNPQSENDTNWTNPGMYTNAGVCNTVQSPSETPQMPSTDPSNGQTYFNLPYGYLTNTNQANEFNNSNQAMQVTTNYGANMNNSTYIQSGQMQDTSVTFANNQGKIL